MEILISRSPSRSTFRISYLYTYFQGTFLQSIRSFSYYIYNINKDSTKRYDL